MNINWEDYLVEGYTKTSGLGIFDDIKQEIGFNYMSIKTKKFQDIDKLIWTNNIILNIHSEYNGSVSLDNYETDDLLETINTILNDYMLDNDLKISGEGYEGCIKNYDDGISLCLNVDGKKIVCIFYKNEHNWKSEF